MPRYTPILPARGSSQMPAKTIDGGVEMSRLINAALVDKEFCDLLLTDPTTALSQGFNGEFFDLSAIEWRFMQTIHAESLTDFAARWVMYKNGLAPVGEYSVNFSQMASRL
jgi:hypothetical protein